MWAYVEFIYGGAGQITMTVCSRLCPVIQEAVMSGPFAVCRESSPDPSS